MNIHEHQAKEILKEFGAPVSNGVVILSLDDIKKEIAKLKSKEFVLKAQIHAGGRGKAGGIKLVKSISELETEAKKISNSKKVINKGLWSSKETKKLYVLENRLGSSSMYKPDMENFDLHNLRKDEYKNYEVTKILEFDSRWPVCFSISIK